MVGMPVSLMQSMFFDQKEDTGVEESVSWDRRNKATQGIVNKTNLYRNLTFNAKMSPHHQHIVMAHLGLNYLQNMDNRQWSNADLAAGGLVIISFPLGLIDITV